MAVDLSALRAATSRDTSVKSAAAGLLRGFTQKLKDAIAADDAADLKNINAVVAEMEASTDDLATAVAENTPAAEPPPA